MNGHDVEKILKRLAPYELAYEGEELGFVIGDPSKEVKRIGVTWRPTLSVLLDCMQRNIDLLINHEPLIQSEKASVVPLSKLKFQPNRNREKILQQSKLTVLRAHSNWDDADGGNNDTLASILDISVTTKIPYGRIGTVTPQSLSTLINSVKKKLLCDYVLVVGELNRLIQVVAVVSGSGNALTEMSEISKLEGADVLISGDIQDSRARYANELDIALIDAGGYYTEMPGMRRLAELFQAEVKGEAEVEYLDPGPPWRAI